MWHADHAETARPAAKVLLEPLQRPGVATSPGTEEYARITRDELTEKIHMAAELEEGRWMDAMESRYDRWVTGEPEPYRPPHTCGRCGFRCSCLAETREECAHAMWCEAIVEEGA